MDLKVTRPCPVDLDARGVDRSGLSFFCDHCARDVHVLSNMSRETAERFLDTHRGEKLCVSYRRDQGGRAVFADDPILADAADDEDAAEAPQVAPLVPISRLRRAGGLPRAAGVSLLLAACAPHDPGQTAEKETIVVVDELPGPAVQRAAPPVVPPVDPDERVVEGEMMIDDVPCVKAPDAPEARGEIAPVEVAAPTADAATPKRSAPKTPKPPKPKLDVVDGGLF
ncbi:MAG: hypothetical protein R3B09_18895 [Nannocystaceae bacterium]